jgi:UPF0176 protein
VSNSEPLLVAAFYRFLPAPGLADLETLQAQLQQLAAAAEITGTVLLAPEGVNGTVCGPLAGVEALLAALRQLPQLAELEEKRSWIGKNCFLRLKVRIKREIVTFGCPTADPTARVGTYVHPAQWDELIADPGTLVIDTRNAYEVAIGSFSGAIDPQTASFREFPQWVAEQLRPLMQQRGAERLALFCTGGIRCEKATAHLLEQGFSNVHHLQGGILSYLEQVPQQQSSWWGECFVFDRRVALNHRLEPGEHSLCHACGLPLAPADLQLPSYVEGVSCHHCLNRFSDADRRRFAERQRQLQEGDILA